MCTKYFKMLRAFSPKIFFITHSFLEPTISQPDPVSHKCTIELDRYRLVKIYNDSRTQSAASQKCTELIATEETRH